jgi:hypothetical protein
VLACLAMAKDRKDPREAALELIRSWGRQGGKLRWKGVTAEQRREIARKAARARWKKDKKKT